MAEELKLKQASINQQNAIFLNPSQIEYLNLEVITDFRVKISY